MSSVSIAFKYQDDITEQAPKDCPPKDATQRDIVAFRFVNKPISDKDFQTYVREGKLQRMTNLKHEAKCRCCGLSMFNTQEAAIRKYNNIKPHPASTDVSFTHLAKGDIKKKHGFCTEPKPTGGHFTLFEFAGIDLKGEFAIVSEL
jgi:hypothetical protein